MLIRILRVHWWLPGWPAFPRSRSSVSCFPQSGGVAPISLFYSYSKKDKALREKLEAHLSLLQDQGVISGWHDRRIEAGTEWDGTISEHLEEAGIILLLVSADFLATRYIRDKEIARAMKRHEEGTARVIPVILRPVHAWHTAPFGKLEALPEKGKAVTLWKNRDQAFADIARGILEAARSLGAVGLNPPTPTQPASVATPPAAGGLQLPLSIALGDNASPDELNALREAFDNAITEFHTYKQLKRFVREFREDVTTRELNIDLLNAKKDITTLYAMLIGTRTLYYTYIACPNGFEEWFGAILKATGKSPAFSRILHVSKNPPGSLMKKFLKEEFGHDYEAMHIYTIRKDLPSADRDCDACDHNDDAMNEECRRIVRTDTNIIGNYVDISISCFTFYREDRKAPDGYVYLAFPRPLFRYLCERICKKIPPGESITIPQFARLLHVGKGRPSSEVKRWIKKKYGFDHNALASTGLTNMLSSPATAPIDE